MPHALQITKYSNNKIHRTIEVQIFDKTEPMIIKKNDTAPKLKVIVGSLSENQHNINLGRSPDKN